MITYHRVTGGEFAAAVVWKAGRACAAYVSMSLQRLRLAVPTYPITLYTLGRTWMVWRPYPDPTLSLPL